MGNVGRTHYFLIPNSIHDPSGHNLLSPQHWAKHTGDGRDKAESRSTITEREVILFWGNRRFQQMIPLTRGSNVADLHTEPSYDKYKLFLVQEGCVEGENAITDDAYSAIHEDIMGKTILKLQDTIIMESNFRTIQARDLPSKADQFVVDPGADAPIT